MSEPTSNIIEMSREELDSLTTAIGQLTPETIRTLRTTIDNPGSDQSPLTIDHDKYPITMPSSRSGCDTIDNEYLMIYNSHTPEQEEGHDSQEGGYDVTMSIPLRADKMYKIKDNNALIPTRSFWLPDPKERTEEAWLNTAKINFLWAADTDKHVEMYDGMIENDIDEEEVWRRMNEFRDHVNSLTNAQDRSQRQCRVL
ncbi:uncharacterized protein IL334_007917 [Kwoniella shivajii]|uniref:Uncharacterized protein n=1 Tax=Kwoniella shivajii TaxID=564305 RepID=A0ABZ1DAW2_9TREE|nr:hypothetical protein IL334_007917 [Kwoniella shivajii]